MRALPRTLAVAAGLALWVLPLAAQQFFNSREEMASAMRQFAEETSAGGGRGIEAFRVVDDSDEYFMEVYSLGELAEFRGILYIEHQDAEDEVLLFQSLDEFNEYLDLWLPPGVIQRPPREPTDEDRQSDVAAILVSGPGGPLDEVFSEILIGRGLFRRPFVPITSDGGAENEGGGLVDDLAATLRYTRFHYEGSEGNTYGVTLGGIRETENFRYGVIVPYDRIDFDSTASDADSFTAAPFLQYVIRRENTKYSIGPYCFYNYTVLNNAADFSMYGAGIGASIEHHFDPIWVQLGIAGEYLDANINASRNSVVRLRAGGTLGFPIVKDRLEGRLFCLGTLADEPFLDGDDEYLSVGGELAGRIGEGFSVTAGYLTSFGHEHLSSHTGYVGALFKLR